jgi:hypothetical protein
MTTHESSDCRDLTSDHLFNLMLDLPQGPEADGTSNKRGCSRWQLQSAAELCYRNAHGTGVTERVSIRDISMSGVGLICPHPVPEGAPATLLLPLEDGRYKVDLLVAYCARTVEGYRIGCRLRLPDAPRLVPMIGRAMSTQEELEP